MHAVPDQHDTALNPQVVAPGTVGVDWYPQLAAATPAMASRPQPVSASATATLAVRRSRVTRSRVLRTPSTGIPPSLTPVHVAPFCDASYHIGTGSALVTTASDGTAMNSA